MAKKEKISNPERVIEIYDALAGALPGYYVPLFGTFIKEDDIKGRKTSIINMIKNQGKITMSQVKKKFQLSAGQATKLVNPLVDEGVVKRQVGKEDRRKVYLVLTKKGEEKIKSLIERVSNQINLILMILEDEEQEQLLTLLEKIVEGVEEVSTMLKSRK